MLNLAISVAKQLKIMPQNGILIMNVQKNYTGEFTSVVVDIENRILMAKYPKEIEGKPIEMKLDNGKYIVSYFQKPQIRAEMMEAAVKSGEDQPFCCKSIRPQIDQEAIFNQFMEKKGTVKNHNYSDGFVFEVKRKKIKNKRWLSRLFVLEDGIREETPNFDPDCISWLSKITVLKTDCEFHKLSFELNLYEIDDWTMKDDYSWRDENLDEDEEGPEWVQNPQFC